MYYLPVHHCLSWPLADRDMWIRYCSWSAYRTLNLLCIQPDIITCLPGDITRTDGISNQFMRSCTFKCSSTRTIRLVSIGQPPWTRVFDRMVDLGRLCNSQPKEKSWKFLFRIPLPMPIDRVLLRRMWLGTNSLRVQLTQALASYK